MSQTSQPIRTSTDARLFTTANNLSTESRTAVVQHLNQSLADTADLRSQLKFAHWNVKGINFYQLHLLFDEVAEMLDDHADVLAERATALGGEAMGTTRMAAATSRIPEIPATVTTGPEYMQAVVERVGIHATNLRVGIDAATSYGDEDTADLYTELSREVDKHLYFLESHLQTQPVGTVSQGMTTQQTLSGVQQPVSGGTQMSTQTPPGGTQPQQRFR